MAEVHEAVAEEGNRMKKILFIFILASLFANGQSVRDVNRYSQSGYLGSTRYLSAGGAFTSLGNDFAAAHLNPAGLAVFRKSEIGLSLGSIKIGTTSNSPYQAFEINTDDNAFTFQNIGFVIKMKPENGWAGAFGISYNRMADFNGKMVINNEGMQMSQSRINHWIANANGVPADDLLDFGLVRERMAWESWLMDDDLQNNYSSQANWSNFDQTHTVEKSGGMSELAFIFSGEKDNRLYIGGSFNVAFVNYTEINTYQERGFGSDSISAFSLVDTNKQRGAGVNLKVGLIYKLDDGFRVGASIHSPTWYEIEQEWTEDMLSEFVNAGINSEIISYYSDPYNWRLTTPWKFNVGVSKIFNKSGFLSVDYEYSMMSTTSAKADSFNIEYLNQELDFFSENFHTIRIGGELRFNRLYFRGGYNFQTSGLSGTESYNNINMVSLGAGYRAKQITIEVAYAVRSYSKDYYIFNTEDVNNVSVSQRPLLFSLAYRFGTNL